MIDGRHFSDIIDVKTLGATNIVFEHYLVTVELGLNLSIVNYHTVPTPALGMVLSD